jgi:DNA-binding transcriptional regulator YdaS (Cro superfamily)
MSKKRVPITLRIWLRPRGRTVLLAHRLDVSESVVSMWGSGIRQIPAERCLEIERATIGHVQCETMRPDINWKRVKI